MIEQHYTPEELSSQIRLLIGQLRLTGRNDLLLKAIGVPLLEELRIEAAKGRLSRLVITEDYRFILEDYHKEVELQPVHKAVYLLFLAHPEGIEFKRLANYREELTRYYMATAKIMDKEKVMESVDHLIDPLDNAINEKCPYAETHRRLQPYLVRTAEGNHPPEGVGGCCYSNVTSWMC